MCNFEIAGLEGGIKIIDFSVNYLYNNTQTNNTQTNAVCTRNPNLMDVHNNIHNKFVIY